MTRDDRLEGTLRGLDEQHVLGCDGKLFEVWRDFDTEETRIRTARGTAVVRIFEHRLADVLSSAQKPLSETVVAQILCAIASAPLQFPHVATTAPAPRR